MQGQARKSQSAAAETLAWAYYWKHSGASRCVPAEQLVSQMLSTCWREFARSIPAQGRVLDLGTGLGYVLKEIGSERADVELVGIDSVMSLWTDDPRLRINAGVMMERLPFGSAEFDCVCSQFGFEYSDMPATAREIARVLRPGGAVKLLIHHSDGAVVHQSARRKAALEWIFEQSGIFEEAGRLLDRCRTLVTATSGACRDAVERAGERQLDSVAAEVAAAVHQVIAPPSQGWAKQVESGLSRLRDHARNERLMLAAIERVSIDGGRIEEIVSILGNSGLHPKPPRILEAQADVPFAWLIDATRPENRTKPS